MTSIERNDLMPTQKLEGHTDIVDGRTTLAKSEEIPAAAAGGILQRPAGAAAGEMQPGQLIILP